jgi:hypothetical protein
MAITLEQEIINKASVTMAREIDREVLWGMLQGIGWTRVMITRLTDNNHAIDIRHWLALNTKKSYEWHNRDFIFEDAQDANWFILKWMS